MTLIKLGLLCIYYYVHVNNNAESGSQVEDYLG